MTPACSSRVADDGGGAGRPEVGSIGGGTADDVGTGDEPRPPVLLEGEPTLVEGPGPAVELVPPSALTGSVDNF